MTIQQLPERPNLEQLKKQAKSLLASARARHPSALARFRALPSLAAKSDAELGGLTLALHDAQSVVAREHGFPSWSALRERVEELTLQFADAVAEFARGSVDRRLARAERLLELRPQLVATDFHAALVFGDLPAVTAHLAGNPTLATRKGGPLPWEPLLYVAHSHWAGKNSTGLVAVARVLLERGADPNTTYPWQGDPKQPLPALWAAACHARHPALAEVLLAAGARPDDGESAYHAAENGDLAMLDLLATHGAQADGGADAGPWGNTPLYFILGHYAGLAHDADVRRGAAWLLAHGANPNRVCYPRKSAETPLHAAARHWDDPMIELLVAHGADINTRRADGRTALTLAELNGRTSAAAALRAHGATEELSPEDRFIAACMRGDRAGALRLRDPAFVAAHAQAFLECGTAAIETMLACGFDVATTGGMGETKLHWAAFTGSLPAVRVLLAHGASASARDKSYETPPLTWCFYASLNQRSPQADFPGVARALLEAGSPLEDGEPNASDDVLEVVAEFRRTKPPPSRV